MIQCFFILLMNNLLVIALTRQDRLPPNGIPVASPSRTVGRAEVYDFPNSGKREVAVLNLNIWGEDEDRIDLHMSYSISGPKPRLPKSVRIDIASIAKTYRFKGKSLVEFIVDGKKWRPISVKPQIADDPPSAMEDYVFRLGIEQFRQIGNAKSVVLKVGGLEIALSAEHRQAFLDMLLAAD